MSNIRRGDARQYHFKYHMTYMYIIKNKIKSFNTNFVHTCAHTKVFIKYTFRTNTLKSSYFLLRLYDAQVYNLISFLSLKFENDQPFHHHQQQQY